MCGFMSWVLRASEAESFRQHSQFTNISSTKFVLCVNNITTFPLKEDNITTF